MKIKIVLIKKLLLTQDTEILSFSNFMTGLSNAV